MMNVLRIALALLFISVLGLWTQASGSSPIESENTTGEVLVRFDVASGPGYEVRTLVAHEDVLSLGEAVYNRRLDLWRIRPHDGTSAEALAEALRDLPGVSAQPNYLYSHAVAPDDPLYRERQLPYYAAVNAPAGWDVETGDAGILVAVIDGGVDIDHPELDSRIWTNPSELPDGLDNDNNGCVDDVNGCSFQGATPTGDVTDQDGHGTFVSGIIAAETNNGAGIAGVAWNATIMPVRALDSSGIGTTEQLIQSILYAAQSGARILNLSLALVPVAGKCPGDLLVESALEQASQVYGALMFGAAGNFDLKCVTYPGSSAYAIAVGASGPPSRPDIRALFSNWGPEVAVAAPGVDLVSTCPVPTVVLTSYCPGTEFGSGSGTSFSTPMVTGLAALLLSHDPQMSNAELRARLTSTAVNLPDENHPNWDGAGRIDMGAALGAESAYAVIDVTAQEEARLTVMLRVGAADSPLCSAIVWDGTVTRTEIVKETFARPGVQGSFGVGECASYWPPSGERPWRLDVATSGPKAALLQGWSAVRGAAVCAVPGLPAVVPPAAPGSFPNACAVGTTVANDEPESATSVEPAALPLRFEPDLRHATRSDDPAPSCLPPPTPVTSSFSRSVWYRIEPSGSPFAIAADTFHTEVDVRLPTVKTVLVAYRETAGGLQEVACNVLHNPAAKLIDSRVVWKADGSSAYYLMAAAFQAIPMGRLTLNISPALLPPNDEPEAATTIALSDPYPVVQAAHSATFGEADPPLSCVPFYGYSVWFRVNEPTGAQLSLTTADSDYNTVAAVFAVNQTGALTEVACNSDEAPGTTTSAVNWQTNGGEYLIVVAAHPGLAGGVLRSTIQAQ